MDAAGFLPSCDWTGLLTVKVAAGATATLPEIRLRKAAVLAIRVNDPKHLLPADDRMLRPLVTGIMDEYGTFRSAERVSRDSTGWNLEIRIPYSRHMSIWIRSWRFKVTDADGKALDAKGARVPLFVAPSTAPRLFEINIVGDTAGLE